VLDSERVDTDALKRSNPIAEVVGLYGIELRRHGSALVGRCPFHQDRSRENLYVYPRTASFYCYRCSAGGDAIRFVQLMDGVAFLEAARRLSGATSTGTGTRAPPVQLSPRSAPRLLMGPQERAVLAAAVELYSQCLSSDPRALAYVESRGLSRRIVERYHVGYARAMLSYSTFASAVCRLRPLGASAC
jgi:DNA primase